MKVRLSDELEMLRETTRKFVDRELAPLEMDIEKTQAIPESAIAALKHMGYFGIRIPREYGGLGENMMSYVVIQEELARAHSCFNTLLSGNNGIGSLSIVTDGTEEQKKKYLPAMARGETISAFALTEPGAGSDAASITTRAVKDGDSYVLNGRKHFITRADIAGIFTVMAVTDPARGHKGITAFIVERGTPGFTIGRIHQTMGSDVVATAELIFEDCRVPGSNMVGAPGEGFKVAMKTLEEGRLSIAARSLGTAERLLDMSVAYARERVQFGKPIAQYQAIQWMLAEMASDIYATRTMLYDATGKRDAGIPAARETSIVKLYATEMLWKASDTAIQIHGGMGYMRELPLERICRDARSYRILEGTSEIQRMIIARDLLGG